MNCPKHNSDHNADNNSSNRRGFSLTDKIATQVLFNGLILLGVVGLWSLSPWLGLGYLAYALISFTLVMRFSICPRCPHLKEDRDCLFLPPSLSLKIIASDRTGPLNRPEKGIFFAAFAGVMAGPVPFLFFRPTYLIFFILMALSLYFVLRRTICKRKCRVEVCPFHPDCTS